MATHYEVNLALEVFEQHHKNAMSAIARMRADLEKAAAAGKISDIGIEIRNELISTLFTAATSAEETIILLMEDRDKDMRRAWQRGYDAAKKQHDPNGRSGIGEGDRSHSIARARGTWPELF